LSLLGGCCNECRQDFYQTMENQIKAFDAKIEELQAKAATLSADAKAECVKAIEHLKELKKAAQEKLAALKNAGDDAWEDLKPALSKAVDDLEEGFEKAKAHF
jgi:hypothetical protein